MISQSGKAKSNLQGFYSWAPSSNAREKLESIHTMSTNLLVMLTNYGPKEKGGLL